MHTLCVTLRPPAFLSIKTPLPLLLPKRNPCQQAKGGEGALLTQPPIITTTAKKLAAPFSDLSISQSSFNWSEQVNVQRHHSDETNFVGAILR